MRAGAELTTVWRRSGGRMKELVVRGVVHPPRRAGERPKILRVHPSVFEGCGL